MLDPRSTPEARAVILMSGTLTPPGSDFGQEPREGDGDTAVDRRVWELESSARPGDPSYIIEESATPGPSYGGRTFSPGHRKFATATTDPLPPEDLQLFTIERLLEAACAVGFDPPQASMLSGTLQRIGVFTCADALALGTRQMSAWAANASDRGQRLGEQRQRTLGNLLLRFTGHELSKERPTATEWPRFYANIEGATPALALPTDRFSWYGALKLLQPHTIGSLRDMSPPERASTSSANAGMFADFVVWDLVENVVEPYNRALDRGAGR